MTSVYQVIPLEKLSESALNPRKAFDEEDLQDLAKSLKAKGCIEPIVVRANGQYGQFELVAGARRFRAAKLAGLDNLPAIVRDYSDVEALEVQICENLQRSNVNPIEEADGFQKLVEIAGYVRKGASGVEVPDVGRIAERIGKSSRYVYDRLTLSTKLIPEAREAGSSGWISASHLVELARLTKKDQRLALSATLMDEAWVSADHLDDAMADWRKPAEQLDDGVERRVMSVRGLQEFIESHIHRDLDGAGFDTDECIDCMKRTDAQLCESTPITERSRCLDRECYEEKDGDRDDEPATAVMESETESATTTKNDEKVVAATYQEDDGEPDAEREKAEKRAQAENEKRVAELKRLVERAKGTGGFTTDEMALVIDCMLPAEFARQKVASITGVQVGEEKTQFELRATLMVACCINDNVWQVSHWNYADGQKPPECTAMKKWAKALETSPVAWVEAWKEESATKPMTGIEIKKRAKAGAKAMKVKVGGKKAKKKGKK